MMRAYFVILISAFSALVSGAGYAMSCSLVGQDDYTIEFNLTATDGYQAVRLQGRGASGTRNVLWYTGAKQTPDDYYIFNEPDLITGRQYNVRITHTESGGTTETKYFLQQVTPVQLGWAQMEVSNQDLRNGRVDVVGDGITSVTQCDTGTIDEPDLPPPLTATTCDLFPEGLQTNRYFEGVPFDQGVIEFSGIENELSFNTNVSSLSFGTIRNLESPYVTCEIKGEEASCPPKRTSGFPNLPISLPDYPTTTGSLVCTEEDCTPSGQSYQSITVEGDAKLILSAGEYWFSNIELKEDAEIQATGVVRVHYQNMILGPDIDIAYDGDDDGDDSARYLTFIGYGADANVEVKADSEVSAAFYLNEGTTGLGFAVTGNENELNIALTAGQFSVSSNENEIKVYDVCAAPVSKVASLQIEPNNFHLTCQDTNPVYVVPYDSDGNRLYDVEGETITLSEQSTSKVTFTYGGFNATEGRYEYTLGDKSDNQYEALRIIARLDSDNNISATSDLMYVPLKFEVNNGSPISLIAGAQSSASVKALACDASGDPVTLNYSKSFDETDVTVTSFAPSSGVYNGLLDFGVTLSNGQGNATVQFNESGILNGQFSDNIRCDDLGANLQGCPAGGSQNVVGNFTLNSRPWAFAVCSTSNTSGTSSSGGPYTAAGDEFDMQVYPIAYRTGVSFDSGRLISDTTVCNASPLNNASLSGSPVYTLALSHELHTPSGGDAGNVTSEDGLTRGNTQVNSGKKHELTKLKWNEVGSVNLVASSSASGYSGSILTGIRRVGRFYPAYFSITETSWTAPDDQSVTYLEQPYKKAVVTVSGYNRAGGLVKNYDNFATGFQAGFTIDQDSSINNVLQMDTLSGTWGVGLLDQSLWTLDDSNAIFKRVLNSGVSVVNGPFNTSDSGSSSTQFGLVIAKGSSSEATEPVSFSSSAIQTTQNFPNQPPARYGRMVMDSVGGNTGTNLYVPLRTEFWNGGQFQITSDDSASTFSTPSTHICKQIIWTSGASSSSSLAIEDGTSSPPNEIAVSSGQARKQTNNSLMAIADTTPELREQVRFWLRLNSSSPQTSESGVTCGSSHTAQPWLQYNWRNLGDEDPSAVITFGIYRGNDKVIFRGETGIFGQ